MSKTICTTVQRQLDEMMLGEECALGVSRHLTECSACREFHQKQTRLREIVGSLGTVSAPADFDFRLRSRLANGNANSTFHLNRSVWSFGQRSAVAATALLLIVGAVVVVQQMTTKNVETPRLVEKNTTENNQLPSPVAPPLTEQTPKANDATQVVSNTRNKERDNVVRRIISNGPRVNRTLMTQDLANESARVFRANETSDVFSVDAAQQPLKVSLFDGRGNPRTISLPTVTFGSQRVVPTATSYAPKGVW